VIEHRGLSCFVDKAVAAEDTHFGAVRRRKERRWVVPPVEQVQAGDMPPVVDTLILVDIAQVIATIPKYCAIGVCRTGEILGYDKVIGRPVGILQQVQAQVPCGKDRLFADHGLPQVRYLWARCVVWDDEGCSLEQSRLPLIVIELVKVSSALLLTRTYGIDSVKRQITLSMRLASTGVVIPR
jgi:hypothetical protein